MFLFYHRHVFSASTRSERANFATEVQKFSFAGAASIGANAQDSVMLSGGRRSDRSRNICDCLSQCRDSPTSKSFVTGHDFKSCPVTRRHSIFMGLRGSKSLEDRLTFFSVLEAPGDGCHCAGFGLSPTILRAPGISSRGPQAECGL